MDPTPPVPKTRPSYRYRTALRWVGGRAGLAGAEGKEEFRVASPPEFRGEAGVWTPEDLLVGAVNACTMTTFLALAEREGLPLVSYASEAEGTLEFEDGGYRFTRVVVRPSIVIQGEEARGTASRLMERAHHQCLIGRSLRAEVVLQPSIEVAATTAVTEVIAGLTPGAGPRNVSRERHPSKT